MCASIDLQWPPVASNDLQWPPMTSDNLQWPLMASKLASIIEKRVFLSVNRTRLFGTLEYNKVIVLIDGRA